MSTSVPVESPSTCWASSGRPGGIQIGGDAPVDGAQPVDGGEEAEPAAAGGQEQGAIGGRHLIGIALVDIGDDEDPGQLRIVEGRGHAHAHRGRQMPRAGAGLGPGPIARLLAAPVRQRGGGHHHAMGRQGHRLR